MSLHALAHDMASKGRNGDSMLVHMTPQEVAGLHALAITQGGKLTINPDTGLPEANFLKKMLPMIAGAALNYFLPGVGTAIGSAIGLGGAAGTAIAVGGATALATGSLSRGLTAGLGAYGGASLASGFAGAGQGALAAQDIAAQQASGAFPSLAEGATQEQLAKYAADVSSLRDAALTKAGEAGFGETMSAGLGQMARNPGMYAGSVLKAGYAAATPMMADEAVSTKTKMPSYTPSPSYYRPYEFDPETKGLRSLGSVDAAKANAAPVTGMANGGAVAFADGGFTLTQQQLASFEPEDIQRLYDTQTPERRAHMQGWSAYTRDSAPENYLGALRGAQIAESTQEGMASLAKIKDQNLMGQYEKLRYFNPVGAGNILGNFDTWTPASQDATYKWLRDYVAPTYTPPEPFKSRGMFQSFIKNGERYTPDGIVDRNQGANSSEAQNTAGLEALPTTTPNPAPGGIGDLVYKPLSQIDPNAARQGLASDPLNDRQQGLERVLAQRGLQDEFNRYFQGTNLSSDISKGYGSAYDPKNHFDTRLGGNEALQRAYFNSVANPLTETERQTSAQDLLGLLTDYARRDNTGFVNSAAPAYAAPEITSTAPPQITSTEAARPTANITPSVLQTQAAAPVPLTSTAPPAITMSAAPTMPSIPVGGGGNAGMATTRPFDYQSAQIDELPKIQQKTAEDAMTGQSLDAYRRLMGMGAAQLTNNTPQAAAANNPSTITPYAFSRPYAQQAAAAATPSSSAVETTSQADKDRTAAEYAAQERSRAFVTNPIGQQISAASYRTRTGGMGMPTESAGSDPVTGEPYQWAYDATSRQYYTAKSNKFAAGGDVPGYAMGGLGDLGGYSDGGRLLRGPGDGVSDSIPATIGGKRPARLADGEFVVPARIVSELGNGSTEAGARKLYAMMDRVQRARGKTTGKKRVAANTRAEQYLPA